MTHDSCLMAANFRRIATYFDQKLSTKTSKLVARGRRSFNIKSKRYLTNFQLLKKKVAKNNDRAAGCHTCIFRSGPIVCLTGLTGPRNILCAGWFKSSYLAREVSNYFAGHESIG